MASLPEYEIIDLSQDDPGRPPSRALWPSSGRRHSSKQESRIPRPRSAQIPDRSISRARSRTPDPKGQSHRTKDYLEPPEIHRIKSMSSLQTKDDPTKRDALKRSSKGSRSREDLSSHDKRSKDGSSNRHHHRTDRHRMSPTPSTRGRASPSPSAMEDDPASASMMTGSRTGGKRGNKKAVLKYMIHEVRELRKQLDPNSETSFTSRRSSPSRQLMDVSQSQVEDDVADVSRTHEKEVSRSVRHHARQVVRDEHGDVIEEHEVTKLLTVKSEQKVPPRTRQISTGSPSPLSASAPTGRSTPSAVVGRWEGHDIFSPISPVPSPARSPRRVATTGAATPVTVIVEREPLDRRQVLKALKK